MRVKNLIRRVAALILVAVLLCPTALAVSSGAVISVALGEVGYEEGENEYSKYGQWYGLPNSYWCDMFVSWCAYTAGMSKTAFPRHASCTDHVKPSSWDCTRTALPGAAATYPGKEMLSFSSTTIAIPAEV